MSADVLQIEGLSVAYGPVEAVREVTLRLQRGKIVTVLGPNGAGKTTLLLAAMGILPSRGCVSLNGQDISGRSVEYRVRHGLSLVPESRALFLEMSVEDNLHLGSFGRFRTGGNALRDQTEEVYALFPRLKERRTQLAGTMSGGERQMLALGRALMARPTVLMLDEPSLGLAPLIVRDMFKTIQSLRDAGISVLLVEQNARAALNIADYGYVLENGQLAMEGPPDILANDRRVVAAYLGSLEEEETPDIRSSETQQAERAPL